MPFDAAGFLPAKTAPKPISPTPNLADLARALRDPRLWPEGFFWCWPDPCCCGLGLAQRLWPQDIRWCGMGSAQQALQIDRATAVWFFATKAMFRREPSPQLIARRIERHLKMRGGVLIHAH